MSTNSLEKAIRAAYHDMTPHSEAMICYKIAQGKESTRIEYVLGSNKKYIYQRAFCLKLHNAYIVTACTN